MLANGDVMVQTLPRKSKRRIPIHLHMLHAYPIAHCDPLSWPLFVYPLNVWRNRSSKTTFFQ